MPSAKAVRGMRARKRRPGRERFLPTRTGTGGLSRMERNVGESTGWERRWVVEVNFRNGGLWLWHFWQSCVARSDLKAVFDRDLVDIWNSIPRYDILARSY